MSKDLANQTLKEAYDAYAAVYKEIQRANKIIGSAPIHREDGVAKLFGECKALQADTHALLQKFHEWQKNHPNQ